MRSFPRLATAAATALLTALALAGCADNEGAGGKMDGAMAPAPQGGAMDKGKMEGGAMDKMKDGAMDKGKMDGAPK
jgi:hypothetical protein